MAVVKTKQPPAIVLAENPVLFGFQSTDQYLTPGVHAEFYMQISTYPAINHGFSLTWNGVQHDFVFVATPGTDPGELPATYSGVGFSTLLMYLLQVLAELKKNYYLSRDFEMDMIGLPANPTFRFISKLPGAAYTVSFQATQGAPVTTLSGSNVAGVDPVIHPFYGIYAQTVINSAVAGEDLITPDAAGESILNISAYLKAYSTSSFTWPVTALLKNRDDLLQRFWIRFAERYGIDPTILKLQTSEGYVTYALPGGVGHMQLDEYERNNNTFWDELQYSKQFLTNQPKTKMVKVDQMEKLFFLNHLKTSVIRMHIELYFYDDVTTPLEYNLSGVSTANWRIIECSFRFLDLIGTLPSPIDKVWKFVVWLVKPDGTVLSERRTYYVDHREELHTHQFIWRNSFGMYDMDLWAGKYERSVDSAKNIYTMTNRYNFTAINPQTQVLQSTEVEMFNASTGWMENKDRANWLREMIMSREVYEVIDGVLYPIVITTAQAHIETAGKTLHNLHIEYTRAFTDEHFSKGSRVSATFIQSFNQGFINNQPAYNITT
jgi:hypothetical protein